MIKVYCAALPEAPIGEPLGCEQRDRILRALANADVQREKYYVWRLLEHAIYDAFGRRASDIDFSLDEKGVFWCKDLFFSLSHSKGALAVAVSDAPCGVDIECIRPVPRAEKIAERVFSPSLRESVAECSDEEGRLFEFFRAWTLYEAEFKRNYTAGGQGKATQSFTDTLTFGEDTYTLSAVGVGEFVLNLTDIHTGGKNAGNN